MPERAVGRGAGRGAGRARPCRRALVARAEEARDVLPDALRDARRRGRRPRPLPDGRRAARRRRARRRARRRLRPPSPSASSARFFHAAAGTLDGPRLVSIGPVDERGAARARLRARRRGGRSHARRAGRRARGGRGALSARLTPHRCCDHAQRRLGAPSIGLAVVGQSSSSRHRRRTTRRTIGNQFGRSSWTGRSSNHGRRLGARSARREQREEPEDQLVGSEHRRRAPRPCRATTTPLRQAVNESAGASPAGVRPTQLAAGGSPLGGDAGHGVGAALGLVLPSGARLGDAERFLLGLVGRQPADGASSAAIVAKSTHSRWRYPAGAAPCRVATVIRPPPRIHSRAWLG